MADKLWWNGSSWVTTETNWAYQNSYSQSSYYYGISWCKIIASDDNKIRVVGLSQGGGSANGWMYSSGYRRIVVDGTQRANIQASDNYTHSVSETVDITDTPNATIRWYGNSIATHGNDGTHYSGSPIPEIDVSTTITTPFITITYIANNTTFTTQTAQLNISTTITDSAPTRTNHTFLGWATSSTAHTADYVSGDSITLSSNLTLYAVWSPAVSITAGEGIVVTFNNISYTNQSVVLQNLVWGQSYSLTISANSGYIIDMRSHPDGLVIIDADEMLIYGLSQHAGCRIDNGTSWDQYMIYIDNGVSWDLYLCYRDNGSSWDLLC